jgi:hypothetical protein
MMSKALYVLLLYALMAWAKRVYLSSLPTRNVQTFIIDPLKLGSLDRRHISDSNYDILTYYAVYE